MRGTNHIETEERHTSSQPNPVTTKENSNTPSSQNGITPAVRRRLPDERHSLTQHFSIGGQEGYLTVGLYEDGAPGERFIRMAKEGSTVSGLMDSLPRPCPSLCNTVFHCNRKLAIIRVMKRTS